MSNTSNTSVCSVCYRQFDFTPEQEGHAVKCPDCGNVVVFGMPPAPGPMPFPTRRKPRKELSSAERIVFCLVAIVALVALLSLIADPVRVPQKILASVGLASAIVLYFAPALLGKNKRNAQAILTLNIFLGWTAIGWVVALVWASIKDPAETHVKCPYCAEPVRREATLCKHCHSKLSPIL